MPDPVQIKLQVIFEKLGELEKAAGGLRKLTDEAAGAKSVLRGGILAGIGMQFATFATQLLDVRRVFGELKEAIDLGGELKDLSGRTGQAVEDLVVLRQAFKNVGMDAGQVGPIINMMQRAMAGVNEEGQPTAEVFGQLGLSLEKLRGQSVVEQLAAISGAFAGLGSAEERAAAAMKIFGRSGGMMLPLLLDPGAMGEARKQLGSLPDTMARNAEQFDKLGDSLNAVGVRITQLFAGVAEVVAPVLQGMADSLNGVDLTEMGRQIGEVALAFADLAKVLVPIMAVFAGGLAINKTIAMLAALRAAIAGVGSGAFLAAAGGPVGLALLGAAAVGGAAHEYSKSADRKVSRVNSDVGRQTRLKALKNAAPGDKDALKELDEIAKGGTEDQRRLAAMIRKRIAPGGEAGGGKREEFRSGPDLGGRLGAGAGADSARTAATLARTARGGGGGTPQDNILQEVRQIRQEFGAFAKNTGRPAVPVYTR